MIWLWSEKIPGNQPPFLAVDWLICSATVPFPRSPSSSSSSSDGRRQAAWRMAASLAASVQSHGSPMRDSAPSDTRIYPMRTPARPNFEIEFKFSEDSRRFAWTFLRLFHPQVIPTRSVN